jgi:hypothetical protein
VLNIECSSGRLTHLECCVIPFPAKSLVGSSDSFVVHPVSSSKNQQNVELDLCVCNIERDEPSDTDYSTERYRAVSCCRSLSCVTPHIIKYRVRGQLSPIFVHEDNNATNSRQFPLSDVTQDVIDDLKDMWGYS